MINFLNISKQDLKIKNKIINKISNIIKLNSFINGKEVKTFEKNFAIFALPNIVSQLQMALMH